MLSAVAYCHALLRERLLPGDLAVDATAGNGYDTHFLAQLTGPEGKVFAFDVQSEAISATQGLLQREGVPEQSYSLIQDSHTTLAERLPATAHEKVAAVIFNLGYLPGGDKTVITRAETTLPAVRSALAFLRPGGLLLIVLYPGHVGGAEEAEVLRDFAAGLPPRQWQVTEYRTLNARKAPPAVLAIEKATTESGLDEEICSKGC
jgi:predicted methyltransferase